MEAEDHESESAGAADDSVGAWMALARAAGYEGAFAPEPETLAQLINLHSDMRSLADRIYDVIQRNIQEAARDRAAAAASDGWAGRLIAGLLPDTLAAALNSERDAERRKRLLHAAVDTLDPQALLPLVQAASQAYEQRASMQLTTLLAKLELRAVRTGNGQRASAESAYRDLAHQLIEVWAAPHFDRDAVRWKAPRRAAGGRTDATHANMPEPERLVQMALESGVVGPVVWAAVAEFSGEGALRRLLGMLKLAPENSRAAELIAQNLAVPARLSMLLREDPVDFEAVDTLLRHLRMAAAEPLIEELIQSPSRGTRRGILDRLARLGPEIEPFIIPRLQDGRWFVLRNMLHVLNEAGCSLQRVPLNEYQNHGDPRVRREAVSLLLKDPQQRDRALTVALRDSDPHTLRLALKAARAGLPDDAVPTLAKRVLDPDYPPEYRTHTITLLGRSRSPLAFEALLRVAQDSTSPRARLKLAPATPELLAALRGLAHMWRQERRAQAVLELAAASTDDQIRAAAEGRGETNRETDHGGLL